MIAPVPQHNGNNGQTVQLSWLQPIGMVSLSLVNFVLRFLTLGAYHFWGRTEVRKRIWSAIRLEGEPLTYTGTGRELFIGFLIIFGVILVPNLLLSLAVVTLSGADSIAMGIYQLVLYLGFLLLIGIGSYRAQRYRLSRTRWRGIRASLTGNSLSYGWTYFWTLLLVPLTLGWIVPWRNTVLQRLMTNDMRFGDRAFMFTGTSGPLYARFAALWIGTILVFLLAIAFIAVSSLPMLQDSEILLSPERRAPFAGLVLVVLALAYLVYLIASAWYRAHQTNHFARHTVLEGARFEARLRGLGLIWIAVSNFLILLAGAIVVLLVAGLLMMVVIAPRIAQLGTDIEDPANRALATTIGTIMIFITIAAFTMLTPVTQARSARYLVERMKIVGELPLGEIAQAPDQGILRGEGLAQAFDVDGF